MRGPRSHCSRDLIVRDSGCGRRRMAARQRRFATSGRRCPRGLPHFERRSASGRSTRMRAWARRLPITPCSRLGPLILIAIAIAGLVFGAEAVQGQVLGTLKGLVGESGTQAIEAMLKGADRPREGMVADRHRDRHPGVCSHRRGGSAEGRPEHGVGGGNRRRDRGSGGLSAATSCPWPECWRSVSCF